MRYAVVNKESNIVENCVLWDGNEEKWKCPETHYLVESVNAGIGDIYDKEEEDFLRKLSKIKPEETPEEKDRMRQLYETKKAELKQEILFVNLEGEIEA